ncbi:MAG: endolytic transglycosylase MltG [Bacteroides sp.]|nr:MAG: endolytic transglycosylase MltG [Bacteroides sp.]
MTYKSKIVLFIIIILIFQIIYYTCNIQLCACKNTNFYVSYRDNVYSISDNLYKSKIINSKNCFLIFAKKMKYDLNINNGMYCLPYGTNYYKLVSILRSKDRQPIKITFSKINTHEEILEYACKKLNMDIKIIKYYLNDLTFLNKYHSNKDNIYCIFIPNTYYINWGIDERNFIDRMYNEFNNYFSKYNEQCELSYHNIYILASIVSMETNDANEMTKIAGVYINRLNKKWKLQADPTIIYVLKCIDNTIKINKVFHKHLKINSPYNTYLYKGLPPGPISIPSLESINAVILYEKHNYFFFRLKKNNNKHFFSEKYVDHYSRKYY